MKKLVALLIIAVVAVPAMAATTISCSQPVSNQPKFVVTYSYDGVGSAPRAFALDIVTTKAGTTIAGVTAAKTGESTSGSKGFGIFPGTIIIDTAAGTISNVGSPIAPSGTPGALGGVGTTGVTVELGSLYADSTGKPATSGTLVTVALNGYTAGTDAITIVGNATRGSLVLEDATSVAVSSGCTLNIATDCFASGLTTYARWVSSSKPACWCAPTSVTGAPVGGTGYQCVGDVAQDKYPGLGYRVYTTDYTALAASWKKKIGDVGYNACADIAHDQYPGLLYGVYTTDFTRLSAMWKKTDAQLNTILGVGGTGGLCGTATVPAAYK